MSASAALLFGELPCDGMPWPTCCWWGVVMTVADRGKTEKPGKPGTSAKRPYVNDGIGDLEQAVARGLTPLELEAVAVELRYRRPKPRTMDLMARIAELLQQKGAGEGR